LNNLIGVSKLILHALEKILNTEINKTHDASRLRSLTYILIGKLSYRVPKLFSDDIRLIQQFFEALKTEDNECCLNIQEALRYVKLMSLIRGVPRYPKQGWGRNAPHPRYASESNLEPGCLVIGRVC